MIIFCERDVSIAIILIRKNVEGYIYNDWNKILRAVLSGRYWLGYKNTDKYDFTIQEVFLLVALFHFVQVIFLADAFYFPSYANYKSLSIHKDR